MLVFLISLRIKTVFNYKTTNRKDGRNLFRLNEKTTSQIWSKQP